MWTYTAGGITWTVRLRADGRYVMAMGETRMSSHHSLRAAVDAAVDEADVWGVEPPASDPAEWVRRAK